MEVSPKPKIELRSRIGRIAAAVGFALVIGSFAVGPAHADNDHHGRYRGHYGRHYNYNRGYRGGGRYYGGDRYYAYQQPDYYYYRPQPNYYSAPDPYYYGSDRRYEARGHGLSLFFGN
jgi:hypothetical protein